MMLHSIWYYCCKYAHSHCLYVRSMCHMHDHFQLIYIEQVCELCSCSFDLCPSPSWSSFAQSRAGRMRSNTAAETLTLTSELLTLRTLLQQAM